MVLLCCWMILQLIDRLSLVFCFIGLVVKNGLKIWLRILVGMFLLLFCMERNIWCLLVQFFSRMWLKCFMVCVVLVSRFSSIWLICDGVQVISGSLLSWLLILVLFLMVVWVISMVLCMQLLRLIFLLKVWFRWVKFLSLEISLLIWLRLQWVLMNNCCRFLCNCLMVVLWCIVLVVCSVCVRCVLLYCGLFRQLISVVWVLVRCNKGLFSFFSSVRLLLMQLSGVFSLCVILVIICLSEVIFFDCISCVWDFLRFISVLCSIWLCWVMCVFMVFSRLSMVFRLWQWFFLLIRVKFLVIGYCR